MKILSSKTSIVLLIMSIILHKTNNEWHTIQTKWMHLKVVKELLHNNLHTIEEKDI